MSIPHPSCDNGAVDFVRAIDEVATFIARRRHRFAVAGGVALAAFGHLRLTLDLDIVTDAAAQPAPITFLEATSAIS